MGICEVNSMIGRRVLVVTVTTIATAVLAEAVAGPPGAMVGALVGVLLGRQIVKLLYPTTQDIHLRQAYWSRP
jgi:hypothetical protein